MTTGTFGSTLQKKWADREVMEKAFGKYAEFAEAVNAEMKAHPEKYNYQAANAIEALADQYDEVTVKAFKAAQEAKSFSEAVDATKDAVSSGWMQTFDILFDELGNKLEEVVDFRKMAAENLKDVPNVPDINYMDPKGLTSNSAKVTENAKSAADATGVSATNMKKSATAMAVSAKSSEELADGMIQVADDSGRVYTMTTEQAKAMLDGKTATEQTAGAVNDLSSAAAQTTGKLSSTAAVMQTCAATGAASTEVLDKAGNAIEGKEEQLTDSTDTAVQNAMGKAQEVAEAGGDAAGEGFGSHFLKAAGNALSGLLSKLGIDTSGITAVVSGAANKVSGFVTVDDMLTNPDKKKTTAPTAKNDTTDSGGYSWRDELKKLLGDIGGGATDAAKDAAADLTSGIKPTSSGTKKTLAEQIEEAYKTRLEANKTAQSIIDREYALWQAENQYTASNDELMAKKAAHAADTITAQTERVSIAQAKYDALYSKWGAEKAETKSAYNELLEEKTSLAELKAQQYTDLFEEVAKRYDTNLDTLENQYNLWSTDNDRTATKRDKILKEREYQTEELAVREKKEANAKEQYEKLSELYGESDLRTIAAYNEWLDAQTESLKVRNSIAEKQYELIEADIEAIENVQSLAVSQMELLQKVYVNNLQYLVRIARCTYLEVTLDLGKHAWPEYAGKYPKAVGIKVTGLYGFDDVIWVGTGTDGHVRKWITNSGNLKPHEAVTVTIANTGTCPGLEAKLVAFRCVNLTEDFECVPATGIGVNWAGPLAIAAGSELKGEIVLTPADANMRKDFKMEVAGDSITASTSGMVLIVRGKSQGSSTITITHISGAVYTCTINVT